MKYRENLQGFCLRRLLEYQPKFKCPKDDNKIKSNFVLKCLPFIAEGATECC